MDGGKEGGIACMCVSSCARGSQAGMKQSGTYTGCCKHGGMYMDHMSDYLVTINGKI